MTTETKQFTDRYTPKNRQRFNTGDHVTDRDGFTGTVTGVTVHNGSLWYDVRFNSGDAVRYDSELEAQ